MKLLAIVLQTQRIRESDLLLNILSEERGRLTCLARGALKSKVRFPGGIDLWDSGYFEFENSRRNQLAVASISQRERWPKLREDLKRYTFAAFCGELVLRLTEEDHAEDGPLCRLLMQALHRLGLLEHGSEQAAVCVYFAVTALSQLGYDLSENEERFGAKPELREWICRMLHEKQAISPYEPHLLESGVALVAAFVESLLGREMKTKHATLEIIMRLTRTSAVATG